ncbi:MAG: CoB--CoM heterodisulfide reductase iron-sulfur subunit B family protein [Smithellaceae bacterium]|nr:CoB--CoM heterodisulfide reductase iron-sulfur subunit B family protein [Smithellaceae bacterium]
MKYLYYPGCSLKGTARDFEESFKAIAPRLGIEIEELADWGCCGATVAKSLNKEMAGLLPQKSLQQAAARGLDLLTLCPNCYLNHRQARDRYADAGRTGDLPQVRHAPGVRQLLEVLACDIGLEDIAQRLTGRLAQIKAMPYYGCLTQRPFTPAGAGGVENPRIMEQLIALTGATPVSFSSKVDCCGGGLLLTREEVALRLSGRILAAACRLSPDCLVVACPLCHFMLDAKQRLIARDLGITSGIPVLYITQFLGLALGIDARRLGFSRLITSPKNFIGKVASCRGS